MSTVFLIAAEPSSAAAMEPYIRSLGAKQALSCARLLSWPGTSGGLGGEIRRHAPGSRFVVCSIEGEWELI